MKIIYIIGMLVIAIWSLAIIMLFSSFFDDEIVIRETLPDTDIPYRNDFQKLQ